MSTKNKIQIGSMIILLLLLFIADCATAQEGIDRERKGIWWNSYKYEGNFFINGELIDDATVLVNLYTTNGGVSPEFGDIVITYGKKYNRIGFDVLKDNSSLEDMMNKKSILYIQRVGGGPLLYLELQKDDLLKFSLTSEYSIDIQYIRPHNKMILKNENSN